MNIIKTKHYVEIRGVDNKGEFLIRIHKDCSQLQMETNNSHEWIDTNYRGLRTIRDALTEVLQDFAKD